MPRGYKRSDKPSRYQPLIDYLAAATDDLVTLTYKEVAALIGAPLRASATLRTNWWTDKDRLHVRAWRALGWRAHASSRYQRVHFTRDAEEG